MTGFGARGRSSESVGRGAARSAQRHLVSGLPVDAHLCDQLLLPLALLAGGEFLTHAPTPHTLTNAETIERFMPGAVELETLPSGACHVHVRGR